MKPSELFQKAKTVLMERGWNQGNYEDDETRRVCLVGALHVSLGHAPNQIDMSLAEESARSPGRYIRKVIEGNWTRWNDAEDRTFNQVIGLLDEATLLAKECEDEAE